MSGAQVRAVRERLGLTQQQAARRWRLSQAYVSLVEHNKRPTPNRLARALARTEPSMATGLRLEMPHANVDDLPRLLGTLGYRGFAQLASPAGVSNPATVVLAALKASFVPARVTEALPWLLVTFVDLDWQWLIDQARLSNVQNRLGFLVHVATQFADRLGEVQASQRLAGVEQVLEEARLAKEDTFGRDLTEVERDYLRQHRPPAARHWNLLTNLRAEDLRYGL